MVGVGGGHLMIFCKTRRVILVLQVGNKSKNKNETAHRQRA